MTRSTTRPSFDPRLIFQAPSDGTYLVRVFAFPATPDSSINLAGGDAYIYRLTLTTGPYLEQALPLALADCPERRPPLSSQSASTCLRPAPAVKLDTTFRPGHALAWHEDWPGEVELPLLAIPILREGSCFQGECPSVATRSLRASPACSLSRDEADTYSLELAKDQEVEIRVEARDAGFSAGPRAPGRGRRRQDPRGARRPGSRDAATSTSASSPRKMAPIRLVLTDLFAQGGPSFVYRLSVTEPKPEFAVSNSRPTESPSTSKEPTKLASRSAARMASTSR